MADPERAAYRNSSSAKSVEETAAIANVRNLDTQQRITGPDANAPSRNLWDAPEALQAVFGYDAEGYADFAVLRYLQEKTS